MFVFELFQISLYRRLDLFTAHRTDELIQVLGAIQPEPIDRFAAHDLLAYTSSLAFFMQQNSRFLFKISNLRKLSYN